MLGHHRVVIRPLPSLASRSSRGGHAEPGKQVLARGHPFTEGVEITMALLVVFFCDQCALHWAKSQLLLRSQ